ncbi:MAG TPA: glycosyltransferase family 2 protein [Vicinamibacterales bacterium]|jgi:glycosyltransferase involved in cell wall biosynthesis
MTDPRSLSVIVPAYCEAQNIVATLENVTTALAALPLTCEILVIDDGSTDGTADLVRANAARFGNVRVVSNIRNMGFGWTYRRGVELAAGDYIVMVHGDNAWSAETLRPFLRRTGDADVVIGYTIDMWKSRRWNRTLASKTFTLLVNRITRRRLHYYNGLQIHPARVLKGMTIESTGYGFQAEVLTKSLRATQTYLEVPMTLMERQHGDSKAFRVRNVVDVARTLARLYSLEHRLAE